MVMRGLWLVVVAGAAGYAGLTVWLAMRAMFFPYALDYGEGIVVWFALKLAQGLNIYATGGPPFDAANYPPVGMLLTAALVPVLEPLMLGRWLNFGAALVVAACVMRFVRAAKVGGSEGRMVGDGKQEAGPLAYERGGSERREAINVKRVGLLSGLLFLGSTFVYHWAPLYRVDLLGLAFTFGGIFWVWRWEGRGSGIGGQGSGDEGRCDDYIADGGRGMGELIVAGCFFLLALYTKHSLVFGPLAAVGAIFLRDRRAGVWFAAALGGIGGAIFLVLEILTRGGWSFGLIALNATVWTPRVFVPLMGSFVVTYAVLLGLAVWGWWRRVRARHLGVLEIYAAAALASLALAGREGAWENYFLEAVAMLCVFAGFGIASLETVGRAPWINEFPANLRKFSPIFRIRGDSSHRLRCKDSAGGISWMLPMLLVVQLGLFWNGHDPRIAEKLFEEVWAGNEKVGAMIRETKGTILAEDMGLLVTNGKPVEYYSFPYSTLARAGRYDQKWETENLRAGKFPLVILNEGTREDVDHLGNFTRAFVSALDYGYGVVSRDARYVVYAPAPLEHLEPRVTFGDRFELVGWSLEPEELRGGEEMSLTIVWRALVKPDTRFTTFAHLEDARGAKLAQDDHEPLGGRYATTQWAQDEMVRETYHLRLPETIPAGEYVLRVGWYDAATQDRLSMGDGEDILELERFRVKQ